MVEPPSPRLVGLLGELGLCGPGDLKRCRRRVARLTRDLPAFDSVWIDALVQRQCLTPFQGRMLDSPHGGRLALGPCVLLDRLGHGSGSETYLARPRDGRRLCVLKRLDVPAEAAAGVQSRLEQLTQRLSAFSHPSLIVPHTSLAEGSSLVTVSRYADGPHLGELLVRRGRFPAQVVLAIARQLADALAALEQHDAIHGDIRLTNVRLTTSGIAILVDAGVRPARMPVLPIRSDVSPDDYDGTAPERIGTGGPATAASDLYALGCLLWHLLAGRPPFTAGDPLARLAAHKTRPIEDVRVHAPDTPGPLAELVGHLTGPQPEDRPASFHQLRTLLGPPRRSGRRLLAAFRAAFNTAARPLPHVAAAPGRRFGWRVPAVLLILVAGLIYSLADQGARHIIVNIAARVTDAVAEPVETGRPGDAGQSARPPAAAQLPLPGPDANGVIALTRSGVYAWERIDAVGPVTIRAAEGVEAEIAVAEHPCRIVATDVTLEGLTFRGESSAPPGTLLLVRSETLVVRGCRFSTPDGDESSIGLAWRELDERDAVAGSITLRNCVFTGGGTALFLSSAPGRLAAANALKLGSGPLISSTFPPAGRDLRVELEHVTLRGAHALLLGRIAHSPHGRIEIDVTDCVFDLSQQGAALARVVAAPTQTWTDSLRISGLGTVASPGCAVAAQIDPATGREIALDPASVLVEGISLAPVEFAGPPGMRVADSVIARFDGPSRSATPPGIDAATLEQPSLEAP